MSATGERWKKLVNRGIQYRPEDGPFFCALELREAGLLTESEVWRALDVSTPNKTNRLPYRLIVRGPVQDVVVLLSDWSQWIRHQNEGMTADEAEALVHRAVIRTYNRRKVNRAYPTQVLRAWLVAKQTEQNEVTV